MARKLIFDVAAWVVLGHQFEIINVWSLNQILLVHQELIQRFLFCWYPSTNSKNLPQIGLEQLASFCAWVVLIRKDAVQNRLLWEVKPEETQLRWVDAITFLKVLYIDFERICNGVIHKIEFNEAFIIFVEESGQDAEKASVYKAVAINREKFIIVQINSFVCIVLLCGYVFLNRESVVPKYKSLKREFVALVSVFPSCLKHAEFIPCGNLGRNHFEKTNRGSSLAEQH